LFGLVRIGAVVGVLCGARPGEASELVADEVDGVDRLAVSLEARLAESATRVDEVAFAEIFLDVGLDTLGEDDDVVPIGVIFPIAVFVLARVVRRDGESRGRAELLDRADTADDLEFCDISHLLVLRCGPWPVARRVMDSRKGGSEPRRRMSARGPAKRRALRNPRNFVLRGMPVKCAPPCGAGRAGRRTFLGRGAGEERIAVMT